MRGRFALYLFSIAIPLSFGLLSSSALAQPGASSPIAFPSGPSIPTGSLTAAGSMVAGAMVSSSMEVNISGPKGEMVQGQVIVTLTKLGGQVVDQITAEHSSVTFNVTANEYTVSIVAPRYQSVTKTVDVTSNQPVKITVELEELSAEDAAASAGFYALPLKIQKDVGKALQALRTNKPNDALHPLQAAQKNAPNNAEIEYLLGLYSSQVKDDAKARAHWMKALESNPKHLGSLLSISGDLLQQKMSAEAIPYATRAVQVEPASWRARILLAEALVMEKRNDDAIKESRRAIELGHERAATAQLVLAHALAQAGDRDGATRALEIYSKSHPTDANAAKDLETLKNPAISAASVALDASAGLDAAAEDAAALPMATNWRPADVDDHVPGVEPGAACALDDVVHKAGQRLTELVSDVDRFAATESFTHESINKWGVPSAPEKRKFDYVVGIQELDHKYLNVEEYRNSRVATASDFPDGVATNGLPALVLIFHPFNAPSFAMSCEGLARLSTGLAWQVHFKQRPDKPNLIKRYRVGADGPSYPAALKGRAWIAADTYQIVRLETDLVAPIPEIRLAADHADIEYRPVQFQGGKVSLWLPQTADVYYDWRGRRIHRRHSFSNYMLFGVDSKQKINVPKVNDSTADDGSAAPKGKPTARQDLPEAVS
jgi:tetratricopeptide (TPR) repeat protein